MGSIAAFSLLAPATGKQLWNSADKRSIRYGYARTRQRVGTGRYGRPLVLVRAGKADLRYGNLARGQAIYLPKWRQ
jgi:hypothetical protein